MQRTLIYTGFSLPGHRKDNQDRYEFFHGTNRTEFLAVVADGMGGHRDGGIAAEAVIRTARDLWVARSPNEDLRELLLRLVNCAHAAVIDAGKIHNSTPRTTLAALYVRDNLAVSVHLGDSRIIQFSAEGFVKRTMDHSVAYLKFLQGTITETEVAADPDQNKLYNCIGGDALPEPDLEMWTLLPLSRFILCTDGYWSLFTEEELMLESERLAQLNHDDSTEELTRSADARIQLRKQHDNTTAIFIHMDSQAKDKGAVKISGKQKAIMILVVLLLMATAFVLLRDSDHISAQSDPVLEGAVALHDAESGEEVSQDLSEDSGEGYKEDIAEEFSAGPLNETENQHDGGDKKTQSPPAEPQLERGVELPEVIPTRRQKVNIPVTSSAEIIDKGEVANKTEVHLKEAGALSEEDRLSPTHPEKGVGAATLLKLQQLHRGLPIYGAEVVVIVENDAITDIESKSVADIALSTEPELSYSQALDKATARSGEVLEAQDEGRLIIYKVRQGYRLAWQGLVVGDTQETLIIDAGNANILHRYSSVYKDNLNNDE